jgi:hypothetical protein
VTTDRDIQRAIEAGERNKNAFELVRNWCAHVRIEKFGGAGMVEQMTGLPIGNHGLKCDHATAGGMFTWDLRDAAVDFYDRNCIDCKKRKPVNVPNLLTFVKERDAARAAQAQKEEAEKAEAARALEARRQSRARLRDGLGPLSAAIVDHIDEYDEHRDEEHRNRLCESAWLAPEHFVPPIVAHIFELTEREPWFAKAGLTILDHVNADSARIARLALAQMGRTWPIDTHARVLLSRLSDIDASQIPDALPAIVELANPNDDYRINFHRPPPAKPDLLLGLWKAHAPAVRQGLDRLLSSRRFGDVELGARGLLVLQNEDQTVMRGFARTMVSKFSRAALLLDDFDGDRSGFRYLRDALVVAFEHSPDEVDALIQEYIGASDRASKDRAYKIYHAVFRGHRHDDPPIPADSRVHRLAFQRILWAATSETSEKTLRTAREVFRGRPYEMVDIARAELDGLLGALLLLDDRLRQHDETPKPENENFLQVLDRSNRRGEITGLMESIVEWASIAAKDDPVLVRKVVDMMDRIPEGRDTLQGIMLGSIEHLGETVDGLKLMLPHLYYGLVGPSVLVRAYAATALGKAPHENIPPLVYEAFSVLLWDQYVAVHKSAVHALHYFEVPESVRGRTAQALLNLIKYYAQKSKEDHFLVECVEQLAYELRGLGKATGNVGKYLIKVLLQVEPLYLQSKVRRLGRALGQTEGFADILIKLIPHVDHHDHWRDDEITYLSELPPEAILSRRAEFEKLGVELATQKPWLAAYVVETLERVGAWAEARRIAESGANLEPTVHNTAIRIHMEFMRIAIAFEEAIAEGRTGELEVQRWEENTARQKEFEADVQRRNSRSRFSRPV